MNKAFKTRQVLGHVSIRINDEQMKRHAFMSCHIVVGEPEFKATKENLLSLIESSSNTNVGDGVFVQVGEPVPIKDHPLKNEIIAKLRSGELVCS